jgi:plastocyanin
MKKMLLRLFVSMLLLGAFMPSGSRAASYTIEVNDTAFSPDTLSILVGDTITWVWISGSHTVTSNGIPPGAAPFNELLDSLHTSFTYKVIFEGRTTISVFLIFHRSRENSWHLIPSVFLPRF